MSTKEEIGIGHVTSTTIGGKYLNPDVYDGLLSEMYSKRTPLDLLIEACNNIGKDRDDSATQKHTTPETPHRNPIKNGNKNACQQLRPTNLETPSNGRDKKSKWYRSSHHNKKTGSNTIDTEDGVTDLCRFDFRSSVSPDQELPEDLRCRERSPDSATRVSTTPSLGSPYLSPMSSLSKGSGSPFSPRSFDEEKRRTVQDDGHGREESDKNQHFQMVGSAPAGKRSSSTRYFESELILRQYLELQSLTQMAILQEYVNNLRHLAVLAKPSTGLAFTHGSAPDGKLSYAMPDILSSYSALSKLQLEDSLAGRANVGGVLPLGLPWFGTTSLCSSPFVSPYGKYLSSFDRTASQNSLHLLGGSPNAEHDTSMTNLDLLRRLSETAHRSSLKVSSDPVTSLVDERELLLSPESRNATLRHSPTRTTEGTRYTLKESSKRHHPYKRSSHSSNRMSPVLVKSEFS